MKDAVSESLLDDLDPHPEIKRCPFDGERVNVLRVPSETIPGHKVYVVECRNMGCILPRTKGRASWVELLEAWNERQEAPRA